jgi:hypothetical protein
MTTNLKGKELKFLPGPKFNLENLSKSKDLQNPNKLYVNAFPITFKKEISIHEYPFKIVPEVTEDYLISKIFAQLSREIKKNYGYFYQSGKSLYSLKEVLEPKDYSIEIAGDHSKIEYTLQIDKKGDTFIIEKGKHDNFSQIHQKMILLIIKDILLTNPTVKVDKDNYILEENPKEPEYPYKIKGIGQTYTIYDGYKLSLKQTESGLCLIVGIKNRIKGDISVYDALMDEDSSYGENLEESIENLIGKRFIPDGSTKSKIIYDIDKELTPKNTNKYYESQSYSNYVDFFKKVFNKDIQDHDQPMIMVKVRGPDKEDKFIYYVPEFCKLCGINQDDIQNYQFMNNLASYTKLNPEQKIKKIDQCLDLFHLKHYTFVLQ